VSSALGFFRRSHFYVSTKGYARGAIVCEVRKEEKSCLDEVTPILRDAALAVDFWKYLCVYRRQSGHKHSVIRVAPLGGVPFTIKVDNKFGATEDLFVFAETLAAQQTIPFDKHHNAEEILLFEDSGATVIVGNKADKSDANSLVFIPRDTWTATNRGNAPIRLMAILSRHGFERHMNAMGR
jgi:hypothetical protein